MNETVRRASRLLDGWASDRYSGAASVDVVVDVSPDDRIQLGGIIEEAACMKTDIPDVPPETLAWRKRVGIDKFDEMWEGVLHMTPAPRRSHQNLLVEIGLWLKAQWAVPSGNRVFHEVNVAAPGAWPDDYRIPDLVLLTPDRFEIDRDVYFDGAPTVVAEIRSEGDETMEKLPFYARLGVPEVWVVDRDTREPELYELVGGRYERQSPAADGWLHSKATAVELRAEAGKRLALRISGDLATQRLLPEDD